MLKPPVMLLTLLLLHVFLDFVLPIWRHPSGAAARIVKRIVMAAVHGGMVFAVFWLAREGWRFSSFAGGTVALGWALISTVVPRIKLKSAWPFVLEQSANVMLLTAVWLTGEGYWSRVPGYLATLGSAQCLLTLLAYLLMMRPSSMFISSLLRPWLATVNNSGSLKNAGMLIGYLERTLILTFVLLERWDAIGFLLTAKSILRFNEIKGADQRPMSEYVLLGTLLSVVLSIAAGLAVSALLKSWAPAMQAACAGSSLQKLLSCL
ncbi:hypothetical protein SAMN05444172_5916 [Burkholderia sp. GAS332]|jgi:hypothetical protein|uniref:hypothetical protein n=1 Tax=Paraburkholderia sp. TaxID=1926495 RepID=UPI000929DC83|nr:hypothetical protein SAMN05444172_5916 [Burkholderia sp. GAS332]